MVPLTLPAAPHIANSRMQIAPTAKASETSDSACTQSIPAIDPSVGLVPGVGLICVKIKRQATEAPD
jgi:hypothetical protein